jgi:hypothetical protein
VQVTQWPGFVVSHPAKNPESGLGLNQAECTVVVVNEDDFENDTT